MDDTMIICRINGHRQREPFLVKLGKEPAS